MLGGIFQSFGFYKKAKIENKSNNKKKIQFIKFQISSGVGRWKLGDGSWEMGVGRWELGVTGYCKRTKALKKKT
jgi:hypothetical protein